MNDPNSPIDFNQQNAFERDKLLNFDPITHTYTLEGNPTPLHSVTNVVSTFFPQFDIASWSFHKAQKEGRTQDDVIKEWERNGHIARNLGTFMHKQIENKFNGRPVEQSFELPMSEEEALNLNISEELKYFDDFLYDVRPTPFRTEWKVYNDEHFLAGTLDLLATNHNGEYVLFDWKRSKRMGKEDGYGFEPNNYNPYQSGLNGLEHLSCTPFVIGCLQQNLYRYILEQSYGISVKQMNLVMLSTIFSRYHCVPVPRMDKEVDIILSYLKGMDQNESTQD